MNKTAVLRGADAFCKAAGIEGEKREILLSLVKQSFGWSDITELAAQSQADPFGTVWRGYKTIPLLGSVMEGAESFVGGVKDIAARSREIQQQQATKERREQLAKEDTETAKLREERIGDLRAQYKSNPRMMARMMRQEFGFRDPAYQQVSQQLRNQRRMERLGLNPATEAYKEKELAAQKAMPVLPGQARPGSAGASPPPAQTVQTGTTPAAPAAPAAPALFGEAKGIIPPKPAMQPEVDRD